MQGVRGVCNLIFLFVLISCVILPAVFADEAMNISDPSSELVNETLNQSEIIGVATTSTGLSAGSTITETLTLAPATTGPITEPTISETVLPEEPEIVIANESSTPSPAEITEIITKTSEPVPEVAGTSSGSTVSVAKFADGREYMKDQVIVRYNSNRFRSSKVMNAYTASSNAKIGAHVHKDFSNAGLSGMQVVTLPENISVDEAIAEYRKDPDVLYAEPNYVYHISAVTPNDPYYTNYLWGLHNTGQTIGGSTGTVDADIDAPEAWDISTGSSTVVVAVIDTGVNYNHPDLSANIWTNPGEIAGNGIDDDLNGYIDDVHGWNFVSNTSNPADDHGHGTHVSGTIGAVGNNGVGVTGVNWNVKIMPLKFIAASGSGDTSDAISAIRYANANGASVISNSWGGPDNSQALKDAIDATSAVVVCAAGNDATNNDVTGHNYPSDYNSSNIISVAATDSNDNLASFSNFGQISVDLAAPGDTILSTSNSGGYVFMWGTSMATPHVSGVAALVKSVNSNLTNLQIRNVILNNVDVKSSLSGKVNTSGRLNAYKAVLAAQRMAQPDKIGFYVNGTWYLDYNGNGVYDSGVDKAYGFGAPGFTPVIGDWNGDGKHKIGFYVNGTWYLDYNGNGVYDSGVDKAYGFGASGFTPLIGDWNGDGITEIGVYINGIWYLDYNGNGVYDQGVDKVYGFGSPGFTPLIGKWN